MDVIVISDDPGIRSGLAAALAHAGRDVATLGSSDLSALERIAPYGHLLILDGSLPDMGEKIACFRGYHPSGMVLCLSDEPVEIAPPAMILGRKDATRRIARAIDNLA